MIRQIFLLCALCILISSCNLLQKTSKKQFDDGFHYQQVEGKNKIVYIDIEDETIRIHPAKIINKKRIIDTLERFQLFPKEMNTGFDKMYSFSKPSFDIDFLTIPLKFRPAKNDVPAQLNTNLNGAIYFGYRQDRYIVNYVSNPLGQSNRKVNHFGFSLGVFTGLGNTFMSPTNTNSILQQEYDGIVWSKGFAGILAINNFTVGLSLGFDYLLDRNHGIWIYQNKPWLGLAFGLNLN